MNESKPALGSLAWCDNHGVDPIDSDFGQAIRMAAARALSEACYPHLPLKAWERCKVCAILADSLRLLASLENIATCFDCGEPINEADGDVCETCCTASF
jgi:hypothetical protein